MHAALRVLPDDFSPVYRCPGCDLFYSSREVAIECSQSNEKANAKPGDIIKIDIGYGWHDGLDHWLFEQKDTFHGKKLWGAYFVVTATTHDKHRSRLHIKTLGIKNGNPTGLCGWTSSTHKAAHIVRNPDQRFIDESRQFIGEVYDHLI